MSFMSGARCVMCGMGVHYKEGRVACDGCGHPTDGCLCEQVPDFRQQFDLPALPAAEGAMDDDDLARPPRSEPAGGFAPADEVHGPAGSATLAQEPAPVPEPVPEPEPAAAPRRRRRRVRQPRKERPLRASRRPRPLEPRRPMPDEDE